MPTVAPSELEALVAMNAPGPIFLASPFIVAGSFVQISPHDERCFAGEVAIHRDSYGPWVGGEIVTLRPVSSTGAATI